MINFLINNSQECVTDPYVVGLSYIKGNFIPDLIAVFPYSTQAPHWIFLRYIKVLQISKYQTFFDDYIIESFQSFLEKKFLISMIKIFDLCVILCIVSHFFACNWMLIGYKLMLNENDGWIYALYDDDLIVPNFWSIYIASIYWVITTFTSVGYGDIRGYTMIEQSFQIVVMMIGIAFYGYMIGTFQTLFNEIEITD